jgi:glycine/D-amino acid oxidase-like deaminating enzyme
VTAAADVVVIGAGIVGVSAAAHLAADGRSVIILERTAIAAGASGRNSGVVQHPFDRVLVDLHLETVALYRALGEREGSGFRLAQGPVGLLSVTRDADAARRETAEWAATHPGLTPTYLPPDEVRRLEPALAPGIAACRIDIGYPVAPDAATHAYAAWANGLGATIRVGPGARPWWVDGEVRGAVLDDGTTIAARDVVVAAGPASPALIDPSGAWCPIRPIWGVVMSVALPEPPTHVLEELGIEIEPEDATAAPDVVQDAGLSFSLVPAGVSSSLGSTFLAYEPDAVALLPRIVARGARFVPALVDARLAAHRVCARPASLDGRPLVGRVPGADHLWIAAGHGPWGISTGPASGRLLADLVAGRLVAPPPALDPWRFGARRLTIAST